MTPTSYMPRNKKSLIVTDNNYCLLVESFLLKGHAERRNERRSWSLGASHSKVPNRTEDKEGFGKIERISNKDDYKQAEFE